MGARQLIAASLVAAFLGGCSVPSLITVCPRIVGYSKDEQVQAADELDKLPKGAELREMMKDYAHLRDQLRRCQ